MSAILNEGPFCVIIGTARDCESHLDKCLNQLRSVADHFSPRTEDVGYLFFENDSVDKSARILAEFCATDPVRRELLVEQGLVALLPKRTHRLAHARNVLLRHLTAKGWLEQLEVLIVADCDEVNASVSLPGFCDALRFVTCNTLISGALDVACANQKTRYYDRWALRTVAAPETSWATCIRFKPEAASSLGFFFPGDIGGSSGIGPQSISVGANVTPVLSAFGGLALYRAAKLRSRKDPTKLASGVEYCGVDASMGPGCCFPFHEEQDCEHVAFHTSLRAASIAAGEGDLRVGICPSFLNAGPALNGSETLGSGGGSGLNNHFLSVAPDGSSYSAGIQGVVQYTREKY